MVVDRLFALKLISILGCTLIAGVFFAFSNFVNISLPFPAHRSRSFIPQFSNARSCEMII
jgi:hypothetical protein